MDECAHAGTACFQGRRRHRRARALATAVLAVLVVALLRAAPAAGRCDVCNLKLQSRTGPYTIHLAKRAVPWTRAPQFVITLTNRSRETILVGGDDPRTRVTLNAVSAREKSMDAIELTESGAPVRVAPGRSVTFHALDPLAVSGVRGVNVTYRNVDSNILRYDLNLRRAAGERVGTPR